MSNIDKRAAIAAYKKREAPAGIYSLTCTGTGQHWVGHSPDLDTMPNRLWFTLRLGSHRSAELQAAFNQYGQDGIAIEVVECFEKAIQPEGAALRERLSSWRVKMGALPA